MPFFTILGLVCFAVVFGASIPYSQFVIKSPYAIYGMMALSTFFTGLSFKAGSKADKWLKTLMMLHGVFFLSCFFMPMTGMFTNMSNGEAGQGGTVALLVWCVYFFPLGVLAYRHFKK